MTLSITTGRPGLAIPTNRPKSAVSQSQAFLSLFGFAAVLFSFRWFGNTDANKCFILLVVALAIPHIWLAVEPQALGPKRPALDRRAIKRILRKLAGLAAIYALVAFAYFLFHGYYAEFVKPLGEILELVWLPWLLLSPAYVWLTDLLMDDPEDGLFQVGLIVTGSSESVQWKVAEQYLLGWLVKGFFVPLMAGYTLDDIRWFLSTDPLASLQKPGEYYFLLHRTIFFIDVAFATAGYLWTMRLIGTHIRSADPTLSGWVVCVICYEPFWAVFSRGFLRYEEGYYWNDWLAGHPIIWTLWSGLILFCLSIYVWGSITFGIRFSNLTNRGILTNGPYRWLKHPHYVSKNISWWLISIPFLTNLSSEVAVRNCFILLGVNLVYYLRAKTEERHLSQDPAYLRYVDWMTRNSLMAILRFQLLGVMKKI